jgi:hypothetical protein
MHLLGTCRLGNDARTSVAYLNSLQHRPVSPRPEAIGRLSNAYDAPTPGVARLEEIAQRWLLEMLNLPTNARLDLSLAQRLPISRRSLLLGTRFLNDATARSSRWVVWRAADSSCRRRGMSSNTDARARAFATDSCADRLPETHSRRNFPAKGAEPLLRSALPSAPTCCDSHVGDSLLFAVRDTRTGAGRYAAVRNLLSRHCGQCS